MSRFRDEFRKNYDQNPAQKRLLRHGLLIAAGSILFGVALVNLHRIYKPIPHAVWVMAAAVPCLTVIAVVVIFALYLKEERDEFQVALIQRSILASAGVFLIFISVWSFLETASHSWHHPLPHLPASILFAAFVLFYSIFHTILRLRHGSCNE